ncbi:MAG: phosphodiester glycosidase family protein [Clostridiales bacterium]|nr:phosphodiester glycosidase family protein [Clostridiales bacterium]
MKKIIFLILLIGSLCLSTAIAEPVIPELTTAGFMPSNSQPYIYASRDDGNWVYIDDELYIRIIRYSTDEAKREMIWYETEIKCAGDTRMESMLTNDSKWLGHTFRIPWEIAEAYHAILAFNDDFYGNRWYGRGTQGIIIRSGIVYSDITRKNDSNGFPPLEVLALFEDGSMKTYKSREYTAQEYLDMGVTDTYAFGPILVQNGQLGERMSDEAYSPYYEPRCALGMIEPNHYILLTVEGRTKTSKGAQLRWLADKMIELGAVEALNLDGGNSTYLYFMGDVINLPQDVKKLDTRRISGMIGIGEMLGDEIPAAE